MKRPCLPNHCASEPSCWLTSRRDFLTACPSLRRRSLWNGPHADEAGALPHCPSLRQTKSLWWISTFHQPLPTRAFSRFRTAVFQILVLRSKSHQSLHAVLRTSASVPLRRIYLRILFNQSVGLSVVTHGLSVAHTCSRWIATAGRLLARARLQNLGC